MSNPLPSGWQEVEDPSSGRSYYHKRSSNETTWERPSATPSHDTHHATPPSTPRSRLERRSSRATTLEGACQRERNRRTSRTQRPTLPAVPIGLPGDLAAEHRGAHLASALAPL